jgi:DNA gyrase subunit B
MLGNNEVVTMITALGTGIGTGEFDLEKLRYHRIIIMTDADVDGAHIRTLLLTFFFRQMTDLVMAGHLYIAQPPLYKAKKGKKSVYLKDEGALTEYLFKQGAANVRIDASGRDTVLEGAEVLSYLEATRTFLSMLSKVARRFDERVVYAFVESFSGSPDALADREGMEQVLAATKKRLESLYRADDIRLTQSDLVRSDSWEGYQLTIRTRQNGVDRLTILDHDFVRAGEFQQLRRFFETSQSYGHAPYTLHSGKADPVEYATAKQLYERIDKDSRKGYDIQRYKGLGEMNPDQLWETTMDPEVRTLVQVKVEDIIEADEIFTLLMGDAVEPRRDFIQTNALNVKNLDV